MKILVPVKRVIDHNVRIRVKPDGSGVETGGVKHAINPFDEIAAEEAVRLKERGVAFETVAVTIGPDAAQEVLRHALALGIDRALHIACEQTLEPLDVAKLLKAIAVREQCGLILLGKQAIDDDAGQVGQMLAGLLGWPQATFASAIEITGNRATVTREVDGGLMTASLALPAVITADLRLNQPRRASMPAIVKARGKPVEKIELDTLGIDAAPRTRLLKVEEPPKRKKGIRVKDVAELVEKLRHEARVIP